MSDDFADDWVVIQDFDSVERDHSQPKFEAQLLDGGETVAVRKTDPMTQQTNIQYLPAAVIADVADRL